MAGHCIEAFGETSPRDLLTTFSSASSRLRRAFPGGEPVMWWGILANPPWTDGGVVPPPVDELRKVPASCSRPRARWWQYRACTCCGWRKSSGPTRNRRSRPGLGHSITVRKVGRSSGMLRQQPRSLSEKEDWRTGVLVNGSWCASFRIEHCRIASRAGTRDNPWGDRDHGACGWL